MYKRPFIREGDTLTPNGGEVKPRPQQYPSTYHGKLACYEGDPVFCFACKSWGKTKCVPPYRPHTDPEGRQANLDGDLCLCKCPTPPRLKASFDDVSMLFEEYEILGMAGVSGWLKYAVLSSNTETYDEQVKFSTTAQSMAGIPIFIEFEDGRTVSGYLGNDGMLPRIETDNAGFYLVSWGDEAIEKMEAEK